MEEWYTELDKRFFVFIAYKLVKDKPSKERLQWESQPSTAAQFPGMYCSERVYKYYSR